tara:strand:- start:301 stop:426 length:126 start_codon:yes stop_codon:yes gene_type:complete
MDVLFLILYLLATFVVPVVLFVVLIDSIVALVSNRKNKNKD